MFTNTFNHLLTAIGVIALIAIAIIVVAIIASITYLAVKICIDSVRETIGKKNSTVPKSFSHIESSTNVAGNKKEK